MKENLTKFWRYLVHLSKCTTTFLIDNAKWMTFTYGALLVIVLSTLLVMLGTTAYEVTVSLESIPKVVQNEMKKTRDTFRQEGELSRNENQESREELILRLKILENEKNETKDQLNALERKIQTNRQTIEANKSAIKERNMEPTPAPESKSTPPHKKLLGIF